MSTFKVITEPTVHLIALSATDPDLVGDFLDAEGASSFKSDAVGSVDFLPELAGRLCYMSYQTPRPGGNQAYLDHILEVGHGSVLEHSVISFVFTGISRSCSHELVRHRTGMSYSQLSQRYVDESDTAFVVPYGVRKDEVAYKCWHEAVFKAREAYCELVERLTEVYRDEPDKTLCRKKARQEARSVLPSATETKIFVTGNVRAWRHFIEQRASRHADREIRHLANKVLEKLQAESRNLFADYVRVDLGDGTFEVETCFRKV